MDSKTKIDIKPNQFSNATALGDYCFSKLPGEKPLYKGFSGITPSHKFSQFFNNPNLCILGWRIIKTKDWPSNGLFPKDLPSWTEASKANMSAETKEMLNQHLTIFHQYSSTEVKVVPNQFLTVGDLCDYCFSKLPNEKDRQDYQTFRRSTRKKFSAMLKNPNRSIKGWRATPTQNYEANTNETNKFLISDTDFEILKENRTWVNMAKNLEVETKANQFTHTKQLILYLGEISHYDFNKDPIDMT